ncbi:MAG: exonuclease SbcCD subunit D C-terminal domain-containing protein [Chitinophagia bacterium]|jgi:exonuclease SbcD
MKIYISSDWHLGKKLHQQDLQDDMQFFLDWLLDELEKNSADYLLIAGDIFDQANPPNDAVQQYYNFLVALQKFGCKAIITAGNHDSPSFVDVPKELLKSLNVTVVGSFPGLDQIDQLFIPLQNREGETVAAVAAIPFLHDRYVRTVGEGEGAKEIDEKIKEGIAKVFSAIGNEMRTRYLDIPTIGMAHLHAQGAQPNEEEREIQIGNLNGIEANTLLQFDYLALGHIHTGQTVIPGRIQYAGSPVSLGFSENQYPHRIIQLTIDEGKITEAFIPVPKQRSLYQLKGTLAEVAEKIKDLQCKYRLTALLDIAIEEPVFNPSVKDQLDVWKETLHKEKNIRVINTRMQFHDRREALHIATTAVEQVKELDPENVFTSLLNDRIAADQHPELLELFREILSDQLQSDQ